MTLLYECTPGPRCVLPLCSNCDPNNPNVWCSLGVLYYQLHQNRDALDAYTRAIKLDPHLCEVSMQRDPVSLLYPLFFI